MVAKMSKWFNFVLSVIIAISVGIQGWQLYRFVNQGARFTAADGQALCERIARLENSPGTCRYLSETKK